LSTKKAGALLAYLALHPGQAQARSKLAALLWGNHSELQARDSLRQALSLVRKALSHVDPRALVAYEDTISFGPTTLTTDAIVFGDLVGQPKAEGLEQAIALYGGELLEGFQVAAPEFESWATAERERYREMALEAMTKLLDQHLSMGAVEPGIRIAARLLAADPLQERVHRTLMELYCRQGRHGGPANIAPAPICSQRSWGSIRTRRPRRCAARSFASGTNNRTQPQAQAAMPGEVSSRRRD
jgi:DNA-binding SARP family transcriptional activator